MQNMPEKIQVGDFFTKPAIVKQSCVPCPGQILNKGQIAKNVMVSVILPCYPHANHLHSFKSSGSSSMNFKILIICPQQKGFTLALLSIT